MASHSRSFATAGYGAVPELATTTDGRVRLYTCQGGGVNSRVSGEGGTTWTLEGQVIASGAVGRAIVCDPSSLSSDGVCVLKTTDAVAAMRRARVEPEGAVLPRPGGA